MGKNLYPDDLYSNSKKNTTLSVSNGLVKNGTADNGTLSPYSVYDDRMSRIIFTIISKNKGKTIYPTANISEKEIHGLIEQSRAAKNASVLIELPIFKQLFSAVKEIKSMSDRIIKGIETIYAKLSNFELNPEKKKNKQLPADFGKKAKTIQIANGELKGKTPVQVLLENPNNLAKLQSQYNWLEQNLGAYPKNQTQMDAIKEAVYMQKNNLLEETQANEVLETGQISLYSPVPKTLVRKKDPKTGLCPVYEISITWTLGDNYPISIRIDNYEAPVREFQNGRLNPDRSKAVNRQTATHRLSETEWFNCIYRIESHMRRFEYLYASMQFKEAKQLSQKIRNNNATNQNQ